jgi:hypothetical protein
MKWVRDHTEPVNVSPSDFKVYKANQPSTHNDVMENQA